MKCDEINKTEEFIWVIKDQDGNFAHKNSIGKSDNHSWLYISFKTFSPECRGYIDKSYAEESLSDLNKNKIIAGFNIDFHLEYLSIDRIIEQHRGFVGDNLILFEKTLMARELLNKAI